MDYRKIFQSIMFEYENKTANELASKYNNVLTFSTFRYLDEIYLSKAISPSKIAEKINVSKPAVTKTLKKLIKNGYVKKNEDVQQGYTYTVSLTPKALNIYEQIIESDMMFIDILDKHVNFSKIDNIDEKLKNALFEYRHIKSKTSLK